MNHLPKVVLITNIPSPYRILLFDSLANILKDKLCLIYLRKTEPNRKWDISTLQHRSIFLKNSLFKKFNLYPDILKNLFREKPDKIIATGFTPTIILALIYAKIARKNFIVFTDSWLHSVNNLTFYHKIIRRLIIPLANRSICLGVKGKMFLIKYGAKPNSIFISPLFINNTYFQKFYKKIDTREFDLIFSGQFISRKLPLFVLQILNELQNRGFPVRFLLIGSGPLENEIIYYLEKHKITYYFPGFIRQGDLPLYYSNAKILLFPTKDDPWGVVANEAFAAGTPAITCANAGASGELIIDSFNGYILPLDVQIWCDKIHKLLTNYNLLESFSQNALHQIGKYNLKDSSKEILKCLEIEISNS